MVASSKLEPVSRTNAPRYAERRAELARAALTTLGELGYARTSLRDIAQNSDFTHGVLHYYFADKVDLILCSVRDYKARCVRRYDDILNEASGRDALIELFLDALSASLHDDAPMHRLWYDLRAQALFEPAFRADVLDIDHRLEAMIWRVLCRIAELGGGAPALSSTVGYAALDGLFQRALLRHIAGEPRAADAMRSDVRLFIPLCLTTSGATPPAGQARARSRR